MTLVVLLSISLTGFALLLPLPPSFRTGWASRLLTFGHVPLFWALTLALWYVGSSGWLLPASVSIFLAAAMEVGQALLAPLTHRTGKLSDFLLGAVGALVAVSCIRVFSGPFTPFRLASYLMVILLLLLWPLAGLLGYQW